MQENDDFFNEKAQMSIMCKNFQLGITRIMMAIKEDKAMVFTVGEIAAASDGSAVFDYRGNLKSDATVANYIYTFEVTQECKVSSDYKAF